MKHTVFLTTVVALGTFSGAAHAQRADADAISLEAIRAHTTFLADDLLEGRGTGSRGYMIAANYVASMFQAAGVEPGTETGTYFQHVPLRHSTVSAAGTSVSLVRDGTTSTFRYGEEFYATPAFRSERASVSGGIAFVGFGVTAPELDYDDYAGIDVHGKIVVTVTGAPPQFDANPSAHYSSGAVKAETAAAHGAVGAVTVWSGPTAAAFPWEVLGRFMRRGSMRWLDAAGEPNSPPAAIVASATVSEDAARKILAGGPRSLDAAAASLAGGESASFAVSGTLSLNVASMHRDISSPNIVGRLEGSDPALRNEYVVYTAHVDHEGLGEPMEGDSIYNGAVDNAASTAALIEIARVMAARRPAPARSILFVGTTAEEEGLLGADYFASNPPVSASQIVANINMDGNHMLFPVADIIAFGDKHSTLGPVVSEVAAEVGVGVSPDPMPEQNFFVRSDHYPFVKRGIPSVFFVNGFESSDPSINGLSVVQQWLGTTYHTPKDDLDQFFDWPSGVHYARVAYLTGLRVANAPQRPRWNDGDFFGETFGRQRAIVP